VVVVRLRLRDFALSGALAVGVVKVSDPAGEGDRCALPECGFLPPRSVLAGEIYAGYCTRSAAVGLE
jgi:hypothetical protein